MDDLRPKLRPLDARWVQIGGELRLWLRDPLGLSNQMAFVPPGLVPLLALLDGNREPGRLAAAFQLQTGTRLSTDVLEAVLQQLERALLLEGPHLESAAAAALHSFRAGSCRPPALAGHSYPAEPAALDRYFAECVAGASGASDWRDERAAADEQQSGAVTEDVVGIAMNGAARADAGGQRPVRGVICPHIDFARGGAVYPRAWLPAAADVAAAELVIVFGTDHAGGPGRLTPTRQHYATPWGVLPTAAEWVDRLCDALGGPEVAYAEELHHKHEHSIELAITWLHWAARKAGGEGAAPRLLPVLCGSFHPYLTGDTATPPAIDPAAVAALCVLREAAASGRTMVVASADLAHVGPAFGDVLPLGLLERKRLAVADRQLLESGCRSGPASFLATLQSEGDRRRVCGLPPIYWALHLLDGAAGEVQAYAQCPADERGGSLVSIAAVVYR